MKYNIEFKINLPSNLPWYTTPEAAIFGYLRVALITSVSWLLLVSPWQGLLPVWSKKRSKTSWRLNMLEYTYGRDNNQDVAWTWIWLPNKWSFLKWCWMWIRRYFWTKFKWYLWNSFGNMKNMWNTCWVNRSAIASFIVDQLQLWKLNSIINGQRYFVHW